MNKIVDSLADWFRNQLEKDSYLTLLLIPLAGFIGIFVCIYEELSGK
jgi:hypothetical protein